MFLSLDINLSPYPVLNDGGPVRGYPGLDKYAMGTVFEDLVRRFNEDNNEEAAGHWASTDVVQLMARLVFEPIADDDEPTTYLLYDGAGGMLTVAEQTLKDLVEQRDNKVSTHLYGQEINPRPTRNARQTCFLRERATPRTISSAGRSTPHCLTMRCFHNPTGRAHLTSC